MFRGAVFFRTRCIEKAAADADISSTNGQIYRRLKTNSTSTNLHDTMGTQNTYNITYIKNSQLTSTIIITY